MSVHHSAASRTQLDERRLRRVARRALQVVGQRGRVAIALAFVSDPTMRRLNREFAGNEYVTDVLSFAAREDTGAFHAAPTAHEYLGDIVIALPQAARQARAAGHSLAREVDVLLAHGVLHLLGYDHANARQTTQMRALEQRILSQ